MYKVSKAVIVETVEFDLRALDFREWPESAKEAAYRLLMDDKKHREMLHQIEPKSWLVAQLERQQELGELIAKEFGL
jgi:hypothetical protein